MLFLDLLDKTAGENMTDLIVGRYITTGHTKDFYKLSSKEQIEYIRNNIDKDDYEYCAMQNGISGEEQKGRVEAVIMAVENKMKIFVGE